MRESEVGSRSVDRSAPPVVWLTVLALLTFGSVAAAQPAGRPYGNMPFSVDPMTGQFHFTAQHIGQDSNLLALHMEWFSVPWDALILGGPLPRAWLAEIDRADALRKSLGLPVYLAVTPISGTRDRLAARAYGDGDQLNTDNAFGAPCEDIALRPDAAAIRRAYHALIDMLVARFQPRFLALSIEVNIYSQGCASAWPSMRDLLNAEYEAQKAEHPDLPVFHTFQVDFLWQADKGDPCFGLRRECLTANVAKLADLHADLWALSSYPAPTFINNGRTLPADYLSAVAALSGRPVAISETGFLSQTFSALVSNQCFPGLPASPQDQVWWMDQVLSDAESLDMPFVVWWANHAPMPFDELAPCRCTQATPTCEYLTLIGDAAAVGFRYFGLMALRDYDGTPTPALDPWRSAVSVARSRGGIAPPGPEQGRPRKVPPRE